MLRHYLARIALLFVALGAVAPNLLANKKPPESPVNLNTATSEQLQQVPGIGPVTADKILQMRKSYGAFKSVDDLLSIKGIGKKRLDKMRKYLTVGKAAAAAKTGSANTPPPKKTSSPPAKKNSPAPPASTDADDSEEPPSR